MLEGPTAQCLSEEVLQIVPDSLFPAITDQVVSQDISEEETEDREDNRSGECPADESSRQGSLTNLLAQPGMADHEVSVGNYSDWDQPDNKDTDSEAAAVTKGRVKKNFQISDIVQKGEGGVVFSS